MKEGFIWGFCARYTSTGWTMSGRWIHARGCWWKLSWYRFVAWIMTVNARSFFKSSFRAAGRPAKTARTCLWAWRRTSFRRPSTSGLEIVFSPFLCRSFQYGRVKQRNVVFFSFSFHHIFLRTTYVTAVYTTVRTRIDERNSIPVSIFFVFLLFFFPLCLFYVYFFLDPV